MAGLGPERTSIRTTGCTDTCLVTKSGAARRLGLVHLVDGCVDVGRHGVCHDLVYLAFLAFLVFLAFLALLPAYLEKRLTTCEASTW